VSSPEETAVENETYRRLWRAVDSLGEKQRTPVILRYAHGLSIPEIATSLDLPEGTVHSRLHHARLRLHALLTEEISHESPANTS
jgi:RNA polymerase sigma-70 factor (ECF subfamily)